MLLTLVEPAKGFERAYNRWYERDHFYGGCMVGPWLFAGSRWVATRSLKDLRWPQVNAIAQPTDAGSYLAVYWVEKGHLRDHFGDWSIHQVRDLYAHGRGFDKRTHVHTSTFDHIGTSYREPDPVPIESALDHRYRGLVVLWWDAVDQAGADLHATLAVDDVPDLLVGSSIEIASSWVPSTPGRTAGDAPMDLGSPAGDTDRLIQLLFVDAEPEAVVDRVRDYTDRVESGGRASLLLASPFIPTVVGTDAYVDQL